MNRLTKTLALAAVALAGAFGATAAQASAANFNVSFLVKNNDSSASMIRSGSLPSGISGLPDPGVAVPAGGTDPSTGIATYSLPLPSVGITKQMSLVYARASDGTSACTFTIKVSHDTNSLPYLLQFSTSDTVRCAVPTGSIRTSDGQFTGQTYVLNWAS